MRELHDLMHEGGANNSQNYVIMHKPSCNSFVTCDISDLTFAFLCLTDAIVLLPMHGKVCSKKLRAQQRVLYAI